MFDRRHCSRKPIDIFFNKYLGGHPHLCRAVNLSQGGMRAKTFTEPARADEAFAVELRLPGDEASLWVWTRRVWARNRHQALAFVAMAPPDRERLHQYLDSVQ